MGARCSCQNLGKSGCFHALRVESWGPMSCAIFRILKSDDAFAILLSFVRRMGRAECGSLFSDHWNESNGKIIDSLNFAVGLHEDDESLAEGSYRNYHPSAFGQLLN